MADQNYAFDAASEIAVTVEIRQSGQGSTGATVFVPLFRPIKDDFDEQAVLHLLRQGVRSAYNIAKREQHDRERHLAAPAGAADGTGDMPGL